MCILNPTNPAVLNLCLPVPEEEATGRTHSAPLRPNFIGSSTVTQPAPGCELFSFFLSFCCFISGKQKSDRVHLVKTQRLLGLNPIRGGF